MQSDLIQAEDELAEVTDDLNSLRRRGDETSGEAILLQDRKLFLQGRIAEIRSEQ